MFITLAHGEYMPKVMIVKNKFVIQIPKYSLAFPLKIACLEEISYLHNWIGKKEINEAIKFYGKCIYSQYLKKIIQ